MRLRITARHMRLTRNLAEHVRRRFLGTLPRHYQREGEVRVEIDHGVGEGKRRYDEVHAQLAVPGALLVVHARARQAFAAIDAAEKQLVRRLDEWRGRSLARRHAR